MVAACEAQRVEPVEEGGDFLEPLRIGEPHFAVDEGQRIGIACHAREKASAEIKHRVFSRAALGPQGRPA